MNHTYDVSEFKINFLKSRKSQFVIKLMKYKTLKLGKYTEAKSRHFRFAELDVNLKKCIYIFASAVNMADKGTAIYAIQSQAEVSFLCNVLLNRRPY